MNGSGKSPIANKREARGRIIAYLERNRGKRQYRHAPSAGWATGKVMRPLSKKFGPGANALRSHWSQIVGEKWTKLSVPTSVRGSKSGTVLHITAKGPAANLIIADSAQIIQKVNMFLGAGTISKIKVKQGQIRARFTPSTRQMPKNNVQKAPDNDEEYGLEQALDKLGSRIKIRAAPASPQKNNAVK
ncbi:MAG: DciA family protein [Robiginitomaculum sp.]